MSFGERLKKYIEFKRTNIRAFEVYSGLKNGTVYRVIKNNTTLNGESISSIAENWKDLNLNWLMTGVGEMLLNISGDAQKQDGENIKPSASKDEKWDKDALLHRADNQIQLQQEMILLLKDIIERQKKAAEKAGFDL